MQHSVQMKEQTAAVNSSGRPVGAIIDESDYIDYARYYQEYDDDEEVEDYYFSSAAGRARVVIGNRRHGPNGYLSSGRMQARPTPPQVTPSPLWTLLLLFFLCALWSTFTALVLLSIDIPLVGISGQACI